MKTLTMEYDKAVGLGLDQMSTLTMTYTKDGFQELVDDIKRNGQLVPILLRDGLILDGRHRFKACMQLCMDVKYKEVGLISDEEALDLVISNSINKATGTDASKVEAYMMCKAKGLKQKDMPNMFKRLSSNYIHKIVYIEKEDPTFLQALLRQNKVSLHNKKYDKLEECGTINSIWRILKDNSGMDSSIVEVVPETIQGPSYNTYINEVMNGPIAEKEYWELYGIMEQEGYSLHPDSVVGRRIISLVNSKYKE